MPDGVGTLLREAGHAVVRLRDVMLTDAPDPVVATACREQGWVLVTHNVKHFRALSQRHAHRHGGRDRLCRIELDCAQIDAQRRMGEALGLIEFEWERLGDFKVGLCISIGNHLIRTHR